MSIDDIKKICVAGAGLMGHQIALGAAIHGYETTCTDISEEMLEKADAFVNQYLPGRVEKEKLSEETARAARERLRFTKDLEEAAGDADFVIEAVVEKLDVKRALFKKLDALCPPRTILASNSSYIVSSKIAGATGRPGRVLNMHFFNPALVMEIVEVVHGPHTSRETVDVTTELCRRMEKTPVLVQKEIYGFIVNRIMEAINREAFYLAEQGIAAPEDIDTAVEGGLNHPMGPFRLVDLVGIDLNYIAHAERFEETRDPADAPSPLIVEKYEKGDFGRKTGRGFYTY
jgi:3-hydroxybutyryl-CoA dehydrogenase